MKLPNVFNCMVVGSWVVPPAALRKCEYYISGLDTAWDHPLASGDDPQKVRFYRPKIRMPRILQNSPRCAVAHSRDALLEILNDHCSDIGSTSKSRTCFLGCSTKHSGSIDFLVGPWEPREARQRISSHGSLQAAGHHGTSVRATLAHCDLFFYTFLVCF